MTDHLFDTPSNHFIDVAIPRAVAGLFTYSVPTHLISQCQVGMRIIVPFGPRGVVTGIIHKIHQEPKSFKVKQILEVLDQQPTYNPLQLALHQWIANYYLSTLGEVTIAGLPSGFKISSESRVQLYPDYPIEDIDKLKPREQQLIEQLQRQESMSYDDISDFLGIKNVYQILKNLQQHRAILLFDQAYEKYTPKKEKRVRLIHNLMDNDDALTKASDLLNNAPKQHAILMAYLHNVPVWESPEANEKGLNAQYLIGLADASDTALKELVRKGIMESFEQIIPRNTLGPIAKPKIPVLTPAQQAARHQILAGFEQNIPVLLFGITGSGKTEIYISLIKDVLESGQQVLFLLPEIALTTQMVGRLHQAFGQDLGVYHSKFSDNERIELWHQLQEGKVKVVLGVRSALFLPFENLGLVIVDEEHDGSYKQNEPAPRYHGRDVALVLAKMHNSQIVLGSGTPSLDSYYKTKLGQWQLASLTVRHGNAVLPNIETIDLRQEVAAKTMNGPFSSVLMDSIDKVANLQQQTILFQNRRGFAPLVLCQQCASSPGCPNCDVALTYHQLLNEMRCHYCGYKSKVPKACTFCGATHLITSGYGTEQIEERLTSLRPKLRVRRMDQDTTRKKNSFYKLITELEQNEVDVLVGTQMVSKGFDFKHVTLVGIFDVDRLMHLPHYRAKEQTFQLLSQVAGRAGRQSVQGQVLIQTYNPSLPILQWIIQHDYQSLYESEIEERQKYLYPPFVWLIGLTIKHTDPAIVQKSSERLRNKLADKIGEGRVLGPAEPSVSKINNYYLRTILIKIEKKGIKREMVKSLILEIANSFMQDLPNKGVFVAVDVDPVA